MQNIDNQKEQGTNIIKKEEYKYTPKEGFVLTHFLTVADIKQSAEFYLRIFGGKVIRSGEPTIIQIANTWLVLNVGGGPTDDKPTITLSTPQNLNEASNFMIIRVADIWASYNEWKNRGAKFITEPKDHGVEIRCYIRDLDGYIIEVGQTTGGLKDIKNE
jgi:predicted enzyme related to lactoylglutathione lyase